MVPDRVRSIRQSGLLPFTSFPRGVEAILGRSFPQRLRAVRSSGTNRDMRTDARSWQVDRETVSNHSKSWVIGGLIDRADDNIRRARAQDRSGWVVVKQLLRRAPSAMHDDVRRAKNPAADATAARSAKAEEGLRHESARRIWYHKFCRQWRYR